MWVIIISGLYPVCLVNYQPAILNWQLIILYFRVLAVQRRRISTWSVVKCECWECVRLQTRGAKASGDLSLWTHHLLWCSTALHLQDHCGWERNVLWNPAGTHVCPLFFSLAGASFPRVIKHCGKNKRATVPDKEESVPLNLNMTFLVQLLKNI